jgi:chitinase-3-like protein 1
MPSNKVMVGVATYGTSFQLLFGGQAKIGSPAMSTDNGEDKMNYNQVCRFLGSNATLEFDPDSLVPFAHKKHSWIAYENEKSVSMKSRFVTIKKLAGTVTYALNYDDWKGECRKDSQTFPLQKAINAILSTESLVSF